MTGKTACAVHEHPRPGGPAPFTTLVELTFQKKNVDFHPEVTRVGA